MHLLGTICARFDGALSTLSRLTILYTFVLAKTKKEQGRASSLLVNAPALSDSFVA